MDANCVEVRFPSCFPILGCVADLAFGIKVTPVQCIEFGRECFFDSVGYLRRMDTA
jgi:hypothetical protein